MANSDLINVYLLDHFAKTLADALRSGKLKFDTISANNFDIKNNINGQSATAYFNQVFTNTLSAGDASFNTAFINYLNSDFIDANQIDAKYITAKTAEIDHIISESAQIKSIEGEYGALATLVTGYNKVTDESVIHLSGKNVEIDNGVIKSAMINSLQADKIEGGTIYTNKIRLMDENSESYWANNLLVMKDANGHTRAVFGSADNNSSDYVLILYDENEVPIFNATGVTPKGLQGKIAEVLNDDTSTTKINADRINLANVVETINVGETSQIFQDQNGNQPLYNNSELESELYAEVIHMIESSSIQYDGQNLGMYFSKQEEELASYKNDTSTKMASIEANYEGLNTAFSETKKTADSFESRVSALEQSASHFQLNFNKALEENGLIQSINELFHFSAQGIIIARKGAKTKFILTHNEEFFTDSPIDYDNLDSLDFSTLNKVTYTNGDTREMMVDRANVNTYLRFNNLGFTPRKGGGMMLRKVKNS